MFLVSKTCTRVSRIPEDFGYRHLHFKYQRDPVDVIAISAKGEERIAKPLLLFCQHSLPQPVIRYDAQGLHPVLPFDAEPFLHRYHIVIIGKPFIPVIADTNKLGEQHLFRSSFDHKLPPREFTARNYLDYYVFRNNFILKQLFKERWVKTSDLVVAGHGDGSSISVRMALQNSKITGLVYSGANPYGPAAALLAAGLAEQRRAELMTAWQQVVANRDVLSNCEGGSYKGVYSFSLPQNEALLSLRIPVLITYDAADPALPLLDLFRIGAITANRDNIVFRGCTANAFKAVPTVKRRPGAARVPQWESVVQQWLGSMRQAVLKGDAVAEQERFRLPAQQGQQNCYSSSSS